MDFFFWKLDVHNLRLFFSSSFFNSAEKTFRRRTQNPIIRLNTPEQGLKLKLWNTINPKSTPWETETHEAQEN